MRKRTKQSIKVRFGLAIKKRRHEMGIAQEALAERAGLHRTYVADIERGARNVSLENIEKLATALQTSISDLFAKYGAE
ncbi:MAG: helix-turn-helix transcriptional regulator [Acidobacteria bacterium]|nr:helix-turn-helix transcriptional regulator [Acidobacteriota bacterium]